MRSIAVLPEGLEEEGKKELIELGAQSVTPLKRAVSFEADMACLYRLHLLARLPFRLLREIALLPCEEPKSLYYEVQNAFNWELWLPPSRSFRVDVTGTSKCLNHTHFTALQVKNALIDLQRGIWGKRSKIDLKDPDLCIHLHVNRNSAVLSLDGSGGSLHKRGYRAAIGEAPLKENLAAGLIRLTNWEKTTPLVDPMCGSGTFLIEAAYMAMNIAPGLRRTFAIEKWADFDIHLWEKEKARAINQQTHSLAPAKFLGCEQDSTTAKKARENIASAGLAEVIEIKTSSFQELLLPEDPGLLVCNPPYGKRLDSEKQLIELYSDLGNFAKKNASGWELWLLSGNRSLSRYLKMKCSKKHPINNGGIDCRWLNYKVN